MTNITDDDDFNIFAIPIYLCTAAKNAYLAQIISPEIKLSTKAIFYY